MSPAPTAPVGRCPALDDVCAPCAFELGARLATATFGYLVAPAHRSGKVEVHYCARHGREVPPLKYGAVELDSNPFRDRRTVGGL